MAADNASPIRRGEGTTPSERYLKHLCERTFLSLWSYPGLYRDQGPVGKEICDLLVVFEQRILLFSDKHCAFPDTGDLRKDWARWFRRAVWHSAEQLYGAERWTKSHPDRLFVDPACTQRFPIDLPEPPNARFHRIVVAHGVANRCRKELGGSGSLMIVPGIVGVAHYHEAPFAVGQIDPARGFVHVLDDTTLDIVLRTLDTITDFALYLDKKERFVEAGRLISVAGEEDLLGYYLRELNEQGEHDFVFREKYHGVALEEGFWQGFLRSPERQRQLDADKVSYAWDTLIEKFGRNILTYKQYEASHPQVSDQERLVRFLAREPRVRRRMLAKAVLGLIEATGASRKGVRVFFPSRPGDPYYVFLLLPKPPHVPVDEYRQTRIKLLIAYCYAAKLRCPDAQYVIGLATEAGHVAARSEDLVCIDVRELAPEDKAEAESLQRDLGLLAKVKTFRGTEREYPDPPEEQVQPSVARAPSRAKGRDRNAPCPCGSGRKYKRCCGRRVP